MTDGRTGGRRRLEDLGVAACAAAWAGPFWALSRLRSGKGVHEQGLRTRGELWIDRRHPLCGASPVLRAGARHRCEVRLSRMVGLPDRLGDVFGIALRLEDVDGAGGRQDLLLNSSIGVPPLHRLFLPSAGWAAQPYSTCLTFDAGGGDAVLGLRPRPDVDPGRSIADVAAVLRRTDLALDVTVAGPLGLPSSIGVLRLWGAAPDDGLSFDPIRHRAGGLRPTGALNRARTLVYRSSRAGRRAGDEALASA